MEIFDELGDILNLLIEFLHNKAFNKEKKLLNRLPYITIYVLILSLTACILIYLGIILIKKSNVMLGISLLVIAILLIIILALPFIKKM